MKSLVKLFLLMFLTMLFSSSIFAQEEPQNKNKSKSKEKTEVKAKNQHGYGFVDADGDGYNDNAPDHDGDGIPNGLDPDFQGAKRKKGFVDLDGDGINDNAVMGSGKDNARKFMNSNNFGRKGTGPQKGNVNGAGNINDDSKGSGMKGKGKKGKGGN